MTKAREVASSSEIVLASGSFNSVASLSISNVLSDRYVYYRFYIRGYVNTSSQTMFLRFRENTTDKSSGYYGGGFVGYFNGTSSVISHNNTSALGITSWYTSATNDGNAVITITRPSATNGIINVLAYDCPNSGGIFSGGNNSSMTNFNGITFYPNAQTMTGSYLLTGIRN